MSWHRFSSDAFTHISVIRRRWWITLALFGSLFFLLLTQPLVHADEQAGIPRLPSSLPESLQTDVQFMEEETVSTAIRHAQPISEAPSNVYVITAEDIRQSGATDVPTILRRIPGMEVMQVTGADFNVSTRGANQLQANKLLVMVDGRSIYQDSQGFVLWKALPVTLPEIERIEVLIGPASVIYGFNAFDGIVHIFTKTPKDDLGTHFQVGGGEFGTVQSSARHSGQQGNLGYRLSGGWDQNQKWRDRDSLAFRSYTMHALAQYDLPGQATVEAAGGYLKANQFDGLAFESVLNQMRGSQAFFRAGYERPNFFLTAFWNRNNNRILNQTHPLIPRFFFITDPDGNDRTRFINNTYNVDTQYALEFGDWFRVTTGANYRHNALSSNAIDQKSRENRLGLFVQSEWNPLAQFRAIAGVRYDMHSRINPTWSPRIALLWSPITDHTLRTTFSIGYRPPTLFETNADLLLTFPGISQIGFQGGTQQLPEQITSYEIAYQGWFWQHRLRVRANGYYNLLRDFFDPQTPGQDNTNFQFDLVFVNRREKAKIWGGEVGLEALFMPWLSGFANYSYRQYDQNFGRGKLTTSVRRGGPQNKVNVGLRGRWGSGITMEVIYHYVGKATYPIVNGFQFAPLFGNTAPQHRVPDYHLLNIRGGYRFWDDRAEVALSVFNALNDRHKEHPLGDTIGSRVLGWLIVKL